MAGYKEDFLGVTVPLPEFSDELAEQVLESTSLRGNIYADHGHYTIVMNAVRRSPIFAALNINQKKMHVVDTRGWRLDHNVGKTNQLGNQYYSGYPYHRGHIAMRQNAAWGSNQDEAKTASDETFYYINATLQHEYFNPDEWYDLESWVHDLSLDRDDKITSFSGPIYGGANRSIEPPGLQPAMVPAAFFKIVCFINQEKKLDVRAFIVMQDAAAILDLSGRKMYDAQHYQTTVKDIEDQTGLRFAASVAAANPLLYHRTTDREEEYNISHFPERIEIDRPEEIVDGTGTRTPISEDEIDVFIAAALPNPEGQDYNNEWISLLNIDARDYDLTDWKLITIPHHSINVEGDWPSLRLGDILTDGNHMLRAGDGIRIQPISPLRLHNEGAAIVLLDNEDRQVDRVMYTKDEVQSGVSVKLYEYQPD